ncbi:MAG TPA: flagellar motor switch protein FliM [Pseudogracilibacillus sp.]|nr:flagellar motor switch protein FliM [Pseudogracilibacillus sp.]
MSDDILSQNEIDALLSAITSGEMDADELKKEEEEQKVKVYDFKRALRFSKDQIRSISRIHENYARLLTTFFSGQLRTYVNINVASVDQIPYEEFIRSIPKMTILNVYSVEPLDGSIILEVNPNIAFTMMDRVLGGQGANKGKAESLTEIESLVITQLFEKAVSNLEEAWSTIVDIEPSLQEFEVNPQFLQMVPPNDTVVVVSLNTQIGETSGMMNICIPHIMLEPIIPKLSGHYWLENASQERDLESYEDISRSLKKTEVEATALLGSANITLNELLHLKGDDVIALNQNIDEPLTFLINQEPKMLVQPGKIHNKTAVQVLEEIQGGEVDL